MAFCSNCGVKLVDNAKFCSECGTKVSSTQNKTSEARVFDGVIHECPCCGNRINSFDTLCEACGYELRGRRVSTAVDIFSEKLRDEEAKPYAPPKGLKPGMVAYEMQKIQGKINLIRSFPIPNTKEDLLEFAIMAASNIETDYWNMTDSEKALSDAWKAKFEQAYRKAMICFKDDDDLLRLEEIFIEKNTSKKRGMRKNSLLLTLPFIILAFVVLLIVILTNR